MPAESQIERLIFDKIFALTLKKIADPDAELIASGILGSITVAELAVALEEELGIRFAFIEVSRENFSSARAIKALVLQKL
jgi:acyl carrier protein